jgi:hypothetical protein
VSRFWFVSRYFGQYPLSKSLRWYLIFHDENIFHSLKERLFTRLLKESKLISVIGESQRSFE